MKNQCKWRILTNKNNRINKIIIPKRVLEAPLKCNLFKNASFLYDQIIPTIKTTKKNNVNISWPFVNIF